MHRLAILAALTLTATLAQLPVAAAEIPDVCGDREIFLEEDEVLVERTLYFHGQASIGNLDGAQDANIEGTATRLTMDPSFPTSDTDKIYVTRLTGIVGNTTFAQNQNHGYWIRRLDGEQQRIVCGGATVFAGTVTGQLPIQLWIDAPRGIGRTPHSTVVGQGTAGEVGEYTVNFGALDVVSSDNLLIQLDSAPPGALTFYDSTGRPSRFTYVTVEKVEVPMEE